MTARCPRPAAALARLALLGVATLWACGRPASPPADAPQPTPVPVAPPRTPPAAGAAANPPAPPVAVARPSDAATAVMARRTALLADGEYLAADELGYYMDVQEARLRQLAPAGFLVARRDSGLVVTIPGRQTFDVSSARLLPAALTGLTELAKVLVEYRLTVIALRGYTDSSGDAGSNVALSQSRAVAVARHLVTEGVAAKRIVAVGHGASDPIADNASAEGRERNRRVEVFILPLRP